MPLSTARKSCAVTKEKIPNYSSGAGVLEPQYTRLNICPSTKKSSQAHQV